VDWERPDAKGCAASCEIVGFLARLSPEKSPGLLVHAASIILAARPLARVVFVGDGAARHMCEELARAYGIENRVIFVGAVYGAENVASYYASFDVVVQPALRAWSETFCIANLEAMASARPIVSFGVGGVGEYFVAAPTRDTCDAAPEHRGCTASEPPTGVAVDRATPEALAEAVLELLEDAGGRDALGRQARRAAAEAFSIEGFLAKYAVLYSRLHRGEDLSDLPFVIT
jgi:glycosyltransferase involved in cell wall biosynthesis